MENKEKNITYYRLLVVTAIIVPIIIGLSYAYFLAVIKGTEDPTILGGQAVSDFILNLVTQNNGYINATNILPIEAADVDTKGNVGTFKVTTGANTYNVNYTLSITDLTITTNLRSNDFKWKLECTSCGDTSKDATGNFASAVTGTDFVLKTNLVIAPSSEDTFKLTIWVEENNGDQSNLINQSFSGKVKVSGEFIYAAPTTTTTTTTAETFTLTIEYKYMDMSVAHETYVGEFESGESYSIVSPTISGYTASPAVVTGTKNPQSESTTVYYIAQE